MKLLGVRLARSIWLAPQHFFNPRGLDLRPLALALKARYQFLRTPLDEIAAPPQTQPQTEPQNLAWKFETGAFNTHGVTIEIISMTIHADGIVVDTRSSTDAADAFLQEALMFGSKEFGLTPAAEIPIRRIYASELNVHYPKRPQLFDPRLAKLVKEIDAAFGDEAVGGVDTLSLQIGNDTTKSPRPLVFRVEREANTAIVDNRFWSYAPIATEPHKRLLQLIEDA